MEVSVKRVCRPRSYLRLCRWPALVHPLLALAVLSSGCAAGSADTADEAATPAGRGSSDVLNSSTTQPANAATTPPRGTPSSTASNTPSSAPSTPATTSASEAPAVSILTPTGSGTDQSSDDDDDPDDADDRDDDDDVDDQDDDGDDDQDDDDDADDDDGDDNVDVTPPTPGAGVPDPSATPVTFTSDIRALLVNNCGRCHASGGLPAFASPNASTAFNVAVSERNAIVREITGGDMPADTCNGGAPGTAGCVSTADLALIRAWIAAGTPQ